MHREGTEELGGELELTRPPNTHWAQRGRTPANLSQDKGPGMQAALHAGELCAVAGAGGAGRETEGKSPKTRNPGCPEERGSGDDEVPGEPQRTGHRLPHRRRKGLQGGGRTEHHQGLSMDGVLGWGEV